MIEVTLYFLENSDLCKQVRQDLAALQETHPHKLMEVDIHQNKTLQKEFRDILPVVEVGPYRLKAPFSRLELQTTLAAAQDRERHIQMIENSPALEEIRRTAKWTRADSVIYWLARHYLAFFNVLVAVYLGLAFLAPVLMKVGLESSAKVLYRGYSLVCHQLSFRSFFLFGEQWVYPRQAAGLEGILSFNQATGLEEGFSTEEIYQARNFIGNEKLGYKVALCERDTAIYAGILFFGLLFGITKRRIPPLPWYLWILLGLVPIGVDGLSQLLSQPPFSLWMLRESTPYWRVLTGGLFGFINAWFGYPMVEETMRDTRQIFSTKWQRLFGT